MNFAGSKIYIYTWRVYMILNGQQAKNIYYDFVVEKQNKKKKKENCENVKATSVKLNRIWTPILNLGRSSRSS